MNKNDLRKLIDEGESSTTEFKRKLNNSFKIAKEISAFSNSKGGIILIGVDDDGTIVGVESEKYEEEVIKEACDFHLEPRVIPEISNESYLGFEILVVIIPESDNKPVKLLIENEQGQVKKRAYIRVGEKSVMASSEMARALRYQNQESEKELKLVIGSKEKSLFNYLEKYERATVKDFAKLVNISKRRAERLMIRLMRAGVLQIHHDTSNDYFTLK